MGRVPCPCIREALVAGGWAGSAPASVTQPSPTERLLSWADPSHILPPRSSPSCVLPFPEVITFLCPALPGTGLA